MFRQSLLFRIIGDFYEILPVIQTYPYFEDEQGYIYIFDCFNQRVKIGKSSNITGRLMDHASNLYSYTGLDMGSVGIFGPFFNISQAESLVKNALIANNFINSSGNEWFYGKFLDAISVIKDIKFDLNPYAVNNVFDVKLIKFIREKFKKCDQESISFDVVELHSDFQKFFEIKDARTMPMYLFKQMLANSSKLHTWLKFDTTTVSVTKRSNCYNSFRD